MVEKLKTIELQIKVKAGENGKIFGGVTSKEISENLQKQYNIEIDKKKIILSETIKNLGTVNVDIKLYEGVTGTVKVKTCGRRNCLKNMKSKLKKVDKNHIY